MILHKRTPPPSPNNTCITYSSKLIIFFKYLASNLTGKWSQNELLTCWVVIMGNQHNKITSRRLSFTEKWATLSFIIMQWEITPTKGLYPGELVHSHMLNAILFLDKRFFNYIGIWVPQQLIKEKISVCASTGHSCLEYSITK